MTRLNLPVLPALILLVLAAFSASMLIVLPTLNPPLEDVQRLFLYMGGSGGVTVLLMYWVNKRGLMRWFKSLRWLLVTLIVITVLLVFFNVVITMQLMYISYHDLILTTALLIFGGLIATASVVVVSDSLIERIRQFGEATRHLAQGRLGVQLSTQGNDELAHLAALFNQMAQQLEAVEQQRQLLEQSRRDLIAWASHDLRAPLTAIRAMNEAMLDGVVSDPETVLRYRQQTQREIEHLGHLIDDLFELAQVDTGHVTLARTRVHLPDLISETLASVSARAAQKNVTVTARIAEPLPPAHIAPDKIQRVLINLIDNAVQHTPPGGKVTLTVRHETAAFVVEVHNTGSLIAPEDLPHIFERFYRAERSRAQDTTGYRGTGLGLAIAHAFVAAHGGSIQASSAPGQGTTFQFTLP